MEGRASEFGIIEWFEVLGNGGGWLFKPKGYCGGYMGTHGPDRLLGADDSFPTDIEAFVALEQYVKRQGRTEKAVPYESVEVDPVFISDISFCEGLHDR